MLAPRQVPALRWIAFWITLEVFQHCCYEGDEISVVNSVSLNLPGYWRFKPKVVRREVVLARVSLTGSTGGFVDGIEEESGADALTLGGSGPTHEFIFVDFVCFFVLAQNGK